MLVSPRMAESKRSWREQAGTALLVVAVVVILVLAYRVLHGMSVRAAHGEAVREILDYQRGLILFAAVLVLATAIALALLLWRLGRATLEQEIFPPAGLPKLIEAEPRRGVAAIYLGRRLRQAAVAAAVSGIAVSGAAAWFAARL